MEPTLHGLAVLNENATMVLGQRQESSEVPGETRTGAAGTEEGIRVRSPVRDINDLKQAEKDLVDSETRYRRLFETAQDGILLLNAETAQVTDVNPF
ncbi:MAG: PAS domain-containing protein, partial [Terriglobia bacterium]